MFGNESKPCVNWQFGCLPPDQGADIVREQMHLAHVYRNNLCRHELDRRAAVEATLARLCPDYVTARDAWQTAKDAIDEMVESIQKKKGEARNAKTDTDDRATLKAARADAKTLYQRLKAVKTSSYESEAVQDALQLVEDQFKEQAKELRANCGLAWGSYLAVEQGCGSFRRGKPPRFMRWTGDGHLAVQCQLGLDPATALLGTDKRIRIDLLPPIGDSRRARETKRRARLWFRVGSEGRDPIWAVIPFIMHRQFPVDCRIKWVHLIRKRIGTRDRWSVTFSLERAGGWGKPDVAASGEVGIDLNWRLLPEGLRVATWLGSDGQSGHLFIPREKLDSWAKPTDLASIRDNRFNVARKQLLDWLGQADGVPDWFTEATRTLPQWRDCSRLAGLARKWKNNRFDGDAEIFSG